MRYETWCVDCGCSPIQRSRTLFKFIVERPSCNKTEVHLGLSQCYATAPKVTQVLTEYHPTINQSYSRRGLPPLAYENTSQRKRGIEFARKEELQKCLLT
jgi:hypothetical protein